MDVVTWQGIEGQGVKDFIVCTKEETKEEGPGLQRNG